MQSDIKNRNGRIYPEQVMKKEVDRYRKEFVDKDRAFGELGHPDGPTINLDKVSHMITKLEQDGKTSWGEQRFYQPKRTDSEKLDKRWCKTWNTSCINLVGLEQVIRDRVCR